MGEAAQIGKAGEGGPDEVGPEFREADPWVLLSLELDAWSDRPAGFWLRDDDATAPSAQLDQLLETAGRHGVPLALAVIPARAERGLADQIASTEGVTVIQHGWDHSNHACVGEKRIELGGRIGPDEALAVLARGRARLNQLFGPRFLPVLAPPWNRIAPSIEGALAEAGLFAVSAFGARPADDPHPCRRNVHLDPILWRQGERFAGTERILVEAVRHLYARRLGTVADEPTGLLTHHLRHDHAAAEFIAAFMHAIARHPNARWLDPREVFAACDDRKGAAHAA